MFQSQKYMFYFNFAREKHTYVDIFCTFASN